LRETQRDLRRLGQDTAQGVIEAVERLADTGYGDVRPLQGEDREWRLRVGDWRVTFTYEDEAGVLEVLRVLPRDRAYRN
jgi:mRNA interferase RelE/StbE